MSSSHDEPAPLIASYTIGGKTRRAGQTARLADGDITIDESGRVVWNADPNRDDAEARSAHTRAALQACADAFSELQQCITVNMHHGGTQRDINNSIFEVSILLSQLLNTVIDAQRPGASKDTIKKARAYYEQIIERALKA